MKFLAMSIVTIIISLTTLVKPSVATLPVIDGAQIEDEFNEEALEYIFEELERVFETLGLELGDDN